MDTRFEVKLIGGKWFEVNRDAAHDYHDAGAEVRQVALHNHTNAVGHTLQERIEIALPRNFLKRAL